MKVNFDGNNFSASMSGFDENAKSETTNISDIAKDLKKHSSVLIFGILALLTALTLLPIGIVINGCAEILYDIFGFRTVHYILMIAMIGIVVLVLSTLFAVISIVSYSKKKERVTTDTIGFVLAIVSFAVSVISVIANICFIVLLF